MSLYRTAQEFAKGLREYTKEDGPAAEGAATGGVGRTRQALNWLRRQRAVLAGTSPRGHQLPLSDNILLVWRKPPSSRHSHSDFSPNDLEVQVPGGAFLITEGNSGIGKTTAIEIAKRGGTVHLVCRHGDPAEGAKSEIIRDSGNQNIYLHVVDLPDPKKILKFVEKFK